MRYCAVQTRSRFSADSGHRDPGFRHHRFQCLWAVFVVTVVSQFVWHGHTEPSVPWRPRENGRRG